MFPCCPFEFVDILYCCLIISILMALGKLTEISVLRVCTLHDNQWLTQELATQTHTHVKHADGRSKRTHTNLPLSIVAPAGFVFVHEHELPCIDTDTLVSLNASCASFSTYDACCHLQGWDFLCHRVNGRSRCTKLRQM